jgi:hypothetical protein
MAAPMSPFTCTTMTDTVVKCVRNGQLPGPQAKTSVDLRFDPTRRTTVDPFIVTRCRRPRAA